ncbi:hypothetical protein ZWY2020_014124 [Hordeum vulgare]|nr:hypothetical protein ZWY2020_014124 [Hordeum vulgare]
MDAPSSVDPRVVIVVCFNCGVEGHFQVDCKQPPACHKCKSADRPTLLCPEGALDDDLALYGHTLDDFGYYQMEISEALASSSLTAHIFVLGGRTASPAIITVELQPSSGQTGIGGAGYNLRISVEDEGVLDVGSLPPGEDTPGPQADGDAGDGRGPPEHRRSVTPTFDDEDEALGRDLPPKRADGLGKSMVAPDDVPLDAREREASPTWLGDASPDTSGSLLPKSLGSLEASDASSMGMARSAAAVAVRAEVSFVDGDEAKRLVAEEGYTVLDVRDRRQYERAHVRASAHVPLYIENEDNDIGTIIKRQAHNNFAGLFYGLSFTKLNRDFTKTVRSKFSPESKLLVVCQEGLRSTAAADALEREGFQNLACITSGLQTLKPGTFETVGEAAECLGKPAFYSLEFIFFTVRLSVSVGVLGGISSD